MDKQKFIDWSYGLRAETVKKTHAGEQIAPDRFFLNTTAHNPALVSIGPAGLNASIKGIGWIPKQEYLEEVLDKMKKHIATYDPKKASDYSKRGLDLLVAEFYTNADKMDFDRFLSLEMAMDYNQSEGRKDTIAHSYVNYTYNSQATALFYQPPAISYEVRGRVLLHGQKGMEAKDMDIYQQFVNAQHDTYHAPNMTRWHKRPAYEFIIEEVYDNSVPMTGFGKKIFSTIDPTTLYNK